MLRYLLHLAAPLRSARTALAGKLLYRRPPRSLRPARPNPCAVPRFPDGSGERVPPRISELFCLEPDHGRQRVLNVIDADFPARS